MLIALKWNDKSAIDWLINGLDEKENPSWFKNVELLRQITGQSFGPKSSYVDAGERDTELAKWREWWARERI